MDPAIPEKWQSCPIEILDWSLLTNSVEMRGMQDVFISHSGKDAAIAEALVDLIRAATDIAPERIRCTSVDGYRLPGGAQTEDQLKHEVHEATCFIALLTLHSLQSPYVLFELGARWGARLRFVPLLAGGVAVGDLKPPLSSLNALSCSSASQLHQMLDEIGKAIGTHVNSAATYERRLQHLISEAAKSIDSGDQDSLQDLTPFSQPTTEAGKELLKLIQNEADTEARGLVEIRREITPGITHFFPKLQYAGSPLAIKTRLFRQGVDELVSLQWLLSPEDNESTNTRTYEYGGAVDTAFG